MTCLSLLDLDLLINLFIFLNSVHTDLNCLYISIYIYIKTEKQPLLLKLSGWISLLLWKYNKASGSLLTVT